MLLTHRGHIIQAIEIRYRLQIGLVLDELLSPVVQQDDMRVGPLDDLAVHLEYKTHDPVRRRMLRAEIHHVVLDVRRALELARHQLPLFAHLPLSPAAAPSSGAAFSSPGRILSIPSHGDRKSKLRNSCCSLTGS